MLVRVPARKTRRLVASVPLLLPWLSAAPSFAEVPDCLVVEAHSAPSGDGRFNHSLTFINGCPMRMYLTTRYSGTSDWTTPLQLLAAGDAVTISLGYFQPTKAFRAQYEGRFARKSDERASNGRVTGTVRAAAPRAEPRARPKPKPPLQSVRSSEPAGDNVPLVELCRLAMRKIGSREGLSESDTKLEALVATCPSRVNRDPEKRRAELECVLDASPREDVGTCFGAR